MGGRYQAYLEYKDSSYRWLGKMPWRWRLLDGKRVFSNRREVARTNDEQLAASQKYGVVPQTLMMDLYESKVMLALKGTSSFRHVEKGDFVISLRSFEGGIEYSDYVGCVSPAYTVLKPDGRILADFYRYFFKSKPYITALQSTTDSLRDGKSITYQQFGSIPLVLPSLQEQHQIANFLDHETAKIDTLIEKQQQLIALLGEKRQAVISHAVTKGLNPDAPMKDSGVEWLGEVPEHWELPKLYHITNRIGDGLHSTPDYKDSTGYYFVNGNNLINGEIVIGDTAKEVPESEYRKQFIYLDHHSVLMSINGTIGNVAIYNGEQIILGKSAAYINCKSNLLTVYLYNYLSSNHANRYYELERTGTTIFNLSLNSIRQMNVCVPPITEQKSISDYCRKNYAKYGLLIQKAESMINLLQERRKALISAAVTGKIDVRDWQPPTDKDIQ